MVFEVSFLNSFLPEMGSFWEGLWLSFRLALLTSTSSLLLSIPLCYCLKIKSSWQWIKYSEFLVYLPLVLPPTVFGFFFLSLFSQNSAIGSFLKSFEISLVFHFQGVFLASLVYSLPFVFPLIFSSFLKIESSLLDTARTLGSTELQVFWRVLLPLCWPSLVRAFLLSFVHTLGELGVVLLIGGSIPGETKTVSIEMFDALQALQFSKVNYMAVVLVFVSTMLISLALLFDEKSKKFM